MFGMQMHIPLQNPKRCVREIHLTTSRVQKSGKYPILHATGSGAYVSPQPHSAGRGSLPPERITHTRTTLA
eukprot:4544816-Amphidinium_carterae.1